MSANTVYTCSECGGVHWQRLADDIAQRAAAVDRIRQSDELAVSVAEAARLLGIGKTTMQTLLASGEIPSAKIKARTVVRRAALETWLETQEAGGAEPCHGNDPLVERIFGETATAPAASMRRTGNGAQR